jgi:hypothetical protein
MSTLRALVLPAALALPGLRSCSGHTTARKEPLSSTGAPPRKTHAAGDYMNRADHLDHLIDNQNEHTARASPPSLAINSGIAAGYMEVTDSSPASARVNKADALAFLRKAADYRTMDSALVLRFAPPADKNEPIAAGRRPARFLAVKMAPRPSRPSDTGSPAACRFQLPTKRPLRAPNIPCSVLLAVCAAAGAPKRHRPGKFWATRPGCCRAPLSKRPSARC